MSSFAPAPGILTGSPPPFGRYLGPIPDLGIIRWDQTGFWRRRLQRKTWMFAGLYTDRWLFGMAVADAGYLGLSFTYFFDRMTGLFVEEKGLRPFGFARDFLPSLQGPWRFASGRRRWRVEPSPEGWRFEFQGKRIAADLTVAKGKGITAVAPALHRPFNSTYKQAADGARGSLSVDGKPISLEASQAVLDFTCGYPARRTFWNWACLVGRSAEGHPIGINLVAHFNDGLENTVWWAGEPRPLGQAIFEPGSDRSRDDWHLHTEAGELDLTFNPEGARRENLLLGLVISRFTQPFGKFHGRFRHQGKEYAVSGYGVVEEHFALW